MTQLKNGQATERQYETMDPRGTRSSARNGAGLRPLEMVLETGVEMGCVSDRASGNCPYGLGTSCPIMEVAEDRRLAQWKRRIAVESGMVIAGLAISAVAVFVVHF